MTVLSELEKDAFWRDGHLVLENAVSPELLSRLQAVFLGWVEESRGHTKDYGETINGKPRFDLEPGHSADKPKLRRVNAPVEASDVFMEAMRDSRLTQAVAELIGPNVKFHHSKINSKQPQSHTEVKYHQDFPFTPHSNDDVITALLMLDDVTEENGCLQIVPGSHRGPIMGLWHGGKFTGAISADQEKEARSKSVAITGRAGTASLMHTRLLHGSDANSSDRARTLAIFVYTAEDAVPLSPNPMPSRYEGLVVKGEATGQIRSIAFELQRPQLPSGTSFFEQQEGADKRQAG